MANKYKVKVIKKSEIKAPAAEPQVKPVSKKAAARDMVETVTSWVSDFQQRKRLETSVAFETLFAR
ncbi:MAG: hypothetical protein ACK4S4_05805 [Pyrinomonadaceae bacterium]